MRNALLIALGVVFGAIIVLGAFALGRTTGPTAPATAAPVVQQVPVPQTVIIPQTVVVRETAPAPAQPQPQPPAATTSCLSIASFQTMWNASTPAAGPGPLILELNKVWDAAGISRDVSAIGNGWLSGPYTVQPMSLVWTDLLGQQPTIPPGQGKWVPLRTQGGWGVFAVYDRVVVPTPGRSARMCESLNPERDLSGWR